MKLVMMEFVTLDGISQGPGSPDEDRSDGFALGGWFVPFLDEPFLTQLQAWARDADAYLFGRRTYQEFAEAWPQMDAPDDVVARSLNGCPKYVASQSLTQDDATWGPAMEDPFEEGHAGVAPDSLDALLLGRFGATALEDRIDDVMLGPDRPLLDVLFPALRAAVPMPV